MLRPLVECVPNFSEGRRGEIVDAIEQGVAAIRGIVVLDRHMDADHNRSVLTFVGEPAAVLEAAFVGIATAARLIDMEQHRGQHPRIGAADVVPFVPLANITLEECAALARQLGERVGRELQLPVYLYEAAAARAERVNLADVRRGEYESLKEMIARDSERAPDFGPPVVGKAGAVAIGARLPLIAFNVYLTTDDAEIARKIAQAVRHSSGGLAHVKALGLLVKGHAQVSMNFTDYQHTPLYRAVELIRREAARFGVSIHHSELVGLIPQAALVDTACWYLQLDEFKPGQILENRLCALNQTLPQSE